MHEVDGGKASQTQSHAHIIVNTRTFSIERGIPGIVDSTFWILFKIATAVAVAVSVGAAGFADGQSRLAAHKGNS
jgi:hypothetical protein